MHSLFEEQITREEVAVVRSIEAAQESYPEALSYSPEPAAFELGPDEYLDQVRRIKAAVGVPVVASLNGTTPGGWTRYARLIQDAGADGLELNLYEVAADIYEPGEVVERRALEVVREVRAAVAIPLAAKISPYYSSVASFARRAALAGADALVLFNRFYQPDIDPEALDLRRVVNLSDSSELLLRVRWLALLFGRVPAPLACTGGVHTPVDVVKAVMAGASVVQTASALLRWGPGYLTQLRDGLGRWLDEHGYESARQMRGSMSQARTAAPGVLERANYARILQTWDAT
ncbi:MAG: dihydroorotate dehydrogenase-like protein [Gemmataceae bacterium]|nr:dihydroorotate dehydrogenase-like protein [Gemmataceae bacterium]